MNISAFALWNVLLHAPAFQSQPKAAWGSLLHISILTCLSSHVCQGPTGTCGGENSRKVNASAGHETCVSRVAEGPAEVTLGEGDRRLAADSQGHTVDVGARLGTETGVEIICHAVRTGDAVEETQELTGRAELGGRTQIVQGFKWSNNFLSLLNQSLRIHLWLCVTH